MGNYLKDKLGANVNRREQRPTHAHRYAGLACGARFRAPGGGGCARPAGGRAAVCGAPAGRVPVLGRFHHRRTPCLCAGLGGPASRYCGAVKREVLEMCDSV